MKIIAVDNHDNGDFSDIIICENINPKYSNTIVGFLNSKYSGNSSYYFFKIVPDDYKLFEREY